METPRFEEKKLWVAVSNTDRTEGRGREVFICYAQYKATALRLGKGQDVMGYDCNVKEVEVVVDNDTCRVFVDSGKHLSVPNADDLNEEGKISKQRHALERAREAGITDEEIALIRQS